MTRFLSFDCVTTYHGVDDGDSLRALTDGAAIVASQRSSSGHSSWSAMLNVEEEEDDDEQGRLLLVHAKGDEDKHDDGDEANDVGIKRDDVSKKALPVVAMKGN